jgi:hypothetical protein
MSAVTTLPWGRPLTRDDLESLPDDGHRYELLDGALLVTPAPTPRHQRAVMGLIAVLTAHVVPPLEVMVAPLDVVLDALLELSEPFPVRLRPADLVR